MRFSEFVSLVALMMAITALSIDIMLPALGDIADALDVAEPNDRQTVLTSYLLGFAAGQLLYGPLSDRFGRKPMLLIGLAIAAVATVVCSTAQSFDVLLAARVVQGFGSAAPRVIAIAVVRDCFAGRDMARVMSLVMTVFVVIPTVAPALGEILNNAGNWTWTFHAILLITLVLIVWSGLRMPETMQPENRVPLSWPGLAGAVRHTVTNRYTIGYGLSMALVFGCLFGYLSSAQQVFVDIYGLGSLFPLAFALIAGVISIASFTNSRLVNRFGMRPVSHLALCGFVAMSGVLTLITAFGTPSVYVFGVLLSLTMFLFGFTMPNFNAMAMEPQGHVAGTASSVIGAFTTALAAFLGWSIGQAFDGTVFPLALGYLVLSAAALGVVFWTEGGRLFATQHA